MLPGVSSAVTLMTIQPSSINASLGPNSPTAFDLGRLTQEEKLVNANFNYEWDVAALARPEMVPPVPSTITRRAPLAEMSFMYARAFGSEVRGTGPSTGMSVDMSQHWLGAAFAFKW